MKIKCLSLGSGNAPQKRKLYLPITQDAEVEWTTLDNNEQCRPHVLFDLNDMEDPDRGFLHADGLYDKRLPFQENTFDELHMYSVIGLYGQQGNADGFFRGMRDLWRILKPGGLFVGGTPAPADEWAWGEPSAKRVINAKTFKYLTREMYEGMGGNAQSDYRRMVDPCWWTILYSEYGSVGDCQTYHWVLRKDVTQ